MIKLGDCRPAARIPSWAASGRVPGLDGLRAASILLVLLCHAAPSMSRGRPSRLVRLAQEGEVGVDVFFAISGFLVTLLLLRESDRTGAIALRGFFARRALRLLPAFGAYLLFVAALAEAGVVRDAAVDWLAASPYTNNGLSLLGHPTAWPLGHLWSLSVEEHFYLIWPVTLAAMGRRRALAALTVVLALAPTIRVLLWAIFPEALPLGLLKSATPARLDSIAAGCLLAFVAHDPSLLARRPRGRAGRVGRSAAAVLLASIVLYTAAGFFDVAIRPMLKAAVIAGLVAFVVFRPGSMVGRLLDTRPMVTLGALSYSLYLWQQPFFDPKSWRPMCRWPTNLLLAVACAAASYLLVERPFLRLKDRVGRCTGSIVPRPHFASTTAAVRS